MPLVEHGIEHKDVPETLVACVRFNLKSREQIPEAFEDLARAIPAARIAGPPYLVLQYFSSYSEGYEVEAGFPVETTFEPCSAWIKRAPAMQVLSIVHHGPLERLRQTRGVLHDFSRRYALISDEFAREVYLGWPDPAGAIELQFVLHPWEALLAGNLQRVLGATGRDTTLEGAAPPTVESSPQDRFRWAQTVVGRLERLASERQQYDVLSRCSHVYPPGQLEKLKAVYEKTRAKGAGALEGVDAVLAFMRADPGWNDRRSYREGRVLYHTKNPADPDAYQQAQTPEEKRAAACFCPVIRERLDEGMPGCYCYCGAGWFRQQWEAATGKPVRVDVVESVLRGDESCKFAVHLAEDL